MTLSAPWSRALALAACVGALGCGADGPAPGSPVVDGPTVELTVAPFTLSGVASVRYDVGVAYLDPDTGAMVPVVTLGDMESNGPRGAFTWIAPCVAGPDGSLLGQVTVRILEVSDTDGPIQAILPPAQTRQFICADQADTRVEFNLTILRPARQGFADITVDIDEVQCSAKADCVPSLVPDGAGVRGPSLVTGLVCTGNRAGLDGVLQTLVYAGDLRCVDPADVVVPTESFFGSETVDEQLYHNTATRLSDGTFVGEGCQLDAIGWLFAQREDLPDVDALVTPIGLVTWRVAPFDNEPLCAMDALVEAGYGDLAYVYDVARDDDATPPQRTVSLLVVDALDAGADAGRVKVWGVRAFDEATGLAARFDHGVFDAWDADGPVGVDVVGAWSRERDGEPLICANVVDEDGGLGTLQIVRGADGVWRCLGDGSDWAWSPTDGISGGRCDLAAVESAPCRLAP